MRSADLFLWGGGISIFFVNLLAFIRGLLMKIRVHGLIGFVVLSVAASCSSKMDGDVRLEEICFAPEYTAEVKGYPFSSKEPFPDFGVFAALGRSGDGALYANDTNLSVFMDNVEVEAVGNTWASVTKYYWPMHDDKDISFFAYAPYISSGAGIDFSVDWLDENSSGEAGKTNKVYLTYTPPVSVVNQKDLLVAESLDKYREVVSLDFKHVLTWVSFVAKYQGSMEGKVPDNTYIRVDELELRGVLGTRTLEIDAEGYQWIDTPSVSAEELTTSYKLSSYALDDEKISNTEYTDFVGRDGALFLLPQEIASGTMVLGVTFSFVYEGESIAQFYTEKPIPAGSWPLGRKVVYTMILDITTASLVDVEGSDEGWVESWGDSGNDYPGKDENTGVVIK